MPEYPARVHGGSGGAVFERRLDLYCVRQPTGAACAGAVAVIRDGADVFAVYSGAPRANTAQGEVGPVYSAGPGGPVAVPTGRVFVRLAEGIGAEQRRDAFAAAGFRIEQTVSYAPNAAWLRPATGGVAQALSGVPALSNLPDVVHVEPQWLLERALRGG